MRIINYKKAAVIVEHSRSRETSKNSARMCTTAIDACLRVFRKAETNKVSLNVQMELS